MKAKKILKISLITIGSLLFLCILIFLFWLGPTVKLIAEGIGSKALGTPVTIDTLSINPRKGTILLSDFSIANPDVFGRSNAVSLASLDIAVDVGSLFTSTVVVHRVELNSPHFVYEQSEASDNVTAFIRNIQEFAGIDSAARAAESAEEEPRKKAKDPKAVLVESLSINDVQMHLANTDDPGLDMKAGFERLSLSMTNGLVNLDGLYVGNPGRLESPDLFRMDELLVALEPASIYSSNVVVQSVQVTRPYAYIEHNPETDTVGEFIKIANGLIAQIPVPTNAAPASATNTIHLAEADETTVPPVAITLNRITIDDVRLNVVNIGDPELNTYLGLEHVDIDLAGGKLDLNHLFLTNAKRLTTPNFFDLEGITVAFTPNPLTAEAIDIEDVQVKKPHLFLELNPASNTAGEFLKIANGFLERTSTYVLAEIPVPETDAASIPSAAATEPVEPPVTLHKLLIDDIRIELLDTLSANAASAGSRTIAGIGTISFNADEGRAQLLNIRAPNTPGFTASNIFHLANIDISIDPASLQSDQIVINEVFINSPEINLEQSETGGNASELQAALMRFVPEAAKMPADPSQTNAMVSASTVTPEPVAIADQPVILNTLLVTNLAINLKLPVASTNAPDGMMGQLGKLNPMDHMSLSKLNPMNNGSTNTVEILDPNAPIRLIAFDLLSLEPLKGLLQIDGLRISNPPGFSKNDLMQVEQVRVDLDPDTLQSDTLLIQDILIAKPRIRYERQIMSDNVKALQTEIEQAATRRQEQNHKKPQTAAANAASETKGQKVVIEHLLVANGMVRAKLSALPAIPVPLPPIELNDFGKEEGGASFADAGSKIFNVLYDSIIGSVGSATGFAGDALKGVGSLFSDAAGGIGNGADKNKSKTEKTPDETKEKRTRRGAGGRRHPLK